MYNLLVSGDTEAWDEGQWTIEAGRCVSPFEYTNAEIAETLGGFSAEAIKSLVGFPCIFAYENARDKDPKLGRITEVAARQGKVRVNFEIQLCTPFLTFNDLEDEGVKFDLDIQSWEMNRTHWAVKDINLDREMSKRGITLPSWASTTRRAIDISNHQFDVALSFPGEVRPLVEKVASELERTLGQDTYFYDLNYTAQLAQPSLDTLLQSIYRNQSNLVVVFIGANYQQKDWCGIEFRAIRDIIATRENSRVMFVRTDPGDVEGVFATDGYIDAMKFTPQQIAEFIVQRAAKP
ncbi:TIR domain-containing protein [Rhodobacteraceae bacterium B1Z28]|uniref:TIR domain-containing protein n=1 Tax=Ruegeria haliotis TaxID=2747601 RepID=A0ABX2PLX2_9RHOB|nr:TIR domain-containing protein [Ruegeria haliotis]NVO55089.1 TIR domain-containing protein [Ruegeria haliotis]